MTRRPEPERIADLEAKAAKAKADYDRRLSIATDPQCDRLWDAEKAICALSEFSGPEVWGGVYLPMATALAARREARWADLKARGLA